jgi:hypothetical protein
MEQMSANSDTLLVAADPNRDEIAAVELHRKRGFSMLVGVLMIFVTAWAQQHSAVSEAAENPTAALAVSIFTEALGMIASVCFDALSSDVTLLVAQPDSTRSTSAHHATRIKFCVCPL